MEKVKPETFFDACVNGDINIVERFISEKQHPIDLKNESQWTGLIMACFNEKYEVAKLLINNGADINATNLKGTSVFMYAKTPVQKNQSNTSFLEYLIEEGADINVKDKKGLTVLDYVKKNKAVVLANWLIKMGAK